MASWRPSTKKLYTTYLNKWAVYCVQREISICSPTLPQACKFLRLLAEKGLGYATVNTARSALSAILCTFDGVTFGNHSIVCRLLKGIYEKNPPKPRYQEFWNVNAVFQLFLSWGNNAQLSLKLLSLKLAMLLLLVTSQRGQTIVNLCIDNMSISDDIVFQMKKLMKHNRVGDPLDSLILRPYITCKRLCVVRTVKMYLKKTQFIRSYSTLLLSFVKPHKPISRDTLSRWTLTVMNMAGLDTTKYKSHSTRGASTSAAKRLGVPINIIMQQASWRSVSSFANYYDKRIEGETALMQQSLLDAVNI